MHISLFYSVFVSLSRRNMPTSLQKAALVASWLAPTFAIITALVAVFGSSATTMTPPDTTTFVVLESFTLAFCVLDLLIITFVFDGKQKYVSLGNVLVTLLTSMLMLIMLSRFDSAYSSESRASWPCETSVDRMLHWIPIELSIIFVGVVVTANLVQIRLRVQAAGK